MFTIASSTLSRKLGATTIVIPHDPYRLQNEIPNATIVQRHVGRAHVVPETPRRISITQFLPMTESSPDGPWLLYGDFIPEVRRLHVTITIVRSSMRRYCQWGTSLTFSGWTTSPYISLKMTLAPLFKSGVGVLSGLRETYPDPYPGIPYPVPVRVPGTRTNP
jgi:hypothetical protein